MEQRYEYLVTEDEANDGWPLKTVTAADVTGRIGPGAVEGLLTTFERPSDTCSGSS